MTGDESQVELFKIKGRGAPTNPGNRFEQIHEIRDEGEEVISARTQILFDHSKRILSTNQSPDVGFDCSVNPYRGCEHGCAYCYARPTHEYLGFSAGLDFESKIIVKEKAPELLRKELASRHWRPRTIAMSGVTDCYQPLERKLEITRGCLDVLREFRNPVLLVTKNFLVTRDIDILGELANHGAAQVLISITTLDSELCGVLEPRTSRPHRRLEAIRVLSNAGVSVGVNIAPVILGLTEHEIPEILREARLAGASFAGYTPLRLPYGLKGLFTEWLSTHRPLQKDKVLGRIREIRGGDLNDSNFESRMKGQGPLAEQIAQLFKVSLRKLGYPKEVPPLSITAFRRPVQAGEQFDLFEVE